MTLIKLTATFRGISGPPIPWGKSHMGRHQSKAVGYNNNLFRTKRPKPVEVDSILYLIYTADVL